MALRIDLSALAGATPRPQSAWFWGVPAFAIGGILLLLMTDQNLALFQFINASLANSSNWFWGHLTVLGDATLTLMLILPLMGHRRDLTWQFFLAAIFATLWTHLGKESLSSLRPPSVLPLDSFHLIGPALENNSFPSGHTTAVFVLAGLVCLQAVRTELRIFVLVLALLVGISRIACGVHWPLDVLGGMLGGWLSAAAGIALAQRWPAGLNIWFQRLLAIIMSSTAIWSVLYYDSGIPNTRPFITTLILACLILSLKGQYRLFQFK